MTAWMKIYECHYLLSFFLDSCYFFFLVSLTVIFCSRVRWTGGRRQRWHLSSIVYCLWFLFLFLVLILRACMDIVGFCFFMFFFSRFCCLVLLFCFLLVCNTGSLVFCYGLDCLLDCR
ncbi:hypothetical protein EX30DRAFT_267946 [Ascodesmis nigricans]|uniref:Uncharacterized protein n=1 Tax=Ascodesmis nigricans TaxID=341454 RepID=A0A4S2MWY1_9PEZI|nr:hypothetical protein EX30DRAFT_267946 [Ascodesmis nigricans]